MPAPLKLIVGLGNPGPEHADTRHNAGFWFLDRLADKFGVAFTADNKLFGLQARLHYGGNQIRLFKPTTYMNDSGRAVQAISSYFHIPAEEILVVHDEIDLEPGTVRLKRGGGHAGHNGVRDIISMIGSSNFNRLRIGVGHPGAKDKVIGSVLGRPSRSEKKLIDEAIDGALELIPALLDGKFEKVMTQLHKSNKQQATSNKNEE